MHGAATHELVGGRRCDGGGRGSSAGLRCLPREEWFEDLLGAPVLLHEACVVKGGGISGLAAAHFYREAAGPDAKILVLDNHDDFGGHAKRNEFRVDGKLLIFC